MATSPETHILPQRYRSVSPLAQGGMGEIYRATDESLGREVAVKVLAEHFARDPSLRARFTREALTAARLSGNPNTVTIFDVGESNGRPYIVMELAGGGTVCDRIAGGRIGVAEALGWLEQAAAALDAAHARGVVHRDVKPANLLLTRDGDVRVADFGIASAAGLTSVTATGTVLGTLGYLAPEQAVGREAGPEVDEYALAVVAYELLAGRRPYQRATGPAEAAAASHEPIPRISLERGDLPDTLDPIFARALAKEPSGRYRSCAELVGDIRRAFEDAAGSTAFRSPLAVSRPPRRRRLPLAAAGMLAVAAAGGIIAAIVLTRPDGREAATTRPPVVKTVTARGDTVTVTAPAPPVTAPAATTSAAPPATPAAPDAGSSSGTALNDAGWQKMKAGDYQGALPLLEQAVRKLDGTGSLGEAYALYNLAFTRVALGSCDGVVAMLDRSQAIQGRRAEIDSLREKAASCG
jgi:serine/threonine-protein kinase